MGSMTLTLIGIADMKLAIILNLIAYSRTESIFRISLDQLNSIASSGETDLLHDVFREDGALVVNNLPPEYAEAVRGLKTNGPKCLESNSLPVFDLPDGSRRQTFALESDTEYPECVAEVSKTIHDYLEHLDTIMSAIILDVIGDLSKTEWTSDDSQGGNILDKIYKEHIHVYSHGNLEQKRKDYTVPLHTDQGLMLFLTPFQEHPLIIRNSWDQDLDLTNIGDDSVIVIIGSALPNWLLKGLTESERFYASGHAVPSLELELNYRTVLARMKVAPPGASPLLNPGHRFQEYFRGSAGAGRWSELMAAQCEEGEAYCWMGCLSLPSGCSQDQAECVNIEAEPCCTETL